MASSTPKIRVVHYGLGHIGREVVQLLLQKPEFELAGVIDNDPLKAGCLLGEVLGLPSAPRIRISDDPETCLRRMRPDAVIHTTGSSVKKVFPQLVEILEAGAHCISSTEELLYPQFRNPALAAKLDQLARKKKVAILGTGINPGFAMEVLPLCLTGVCQSVSSIRVTRVLNAGHRRLPLQRKIGAGMDAKEFQRLVRAGKLGHVGLLESLMLLASGLGWKLERCREKIEPKLALSRLTTNHLVIPRGRVAGLHQIATGYRKGKAVLVLDLSMFIGAKESFDLVEIHGTPSIESRVNGGIHGDLATVAALVNAVPRVIESERTGLISMLDLPLPRIA